MSFKSIISSCNTNAQTPRCTQLCVIGGDRFFAYFLRSYTELLGNKSADWLTYLRFVLIAPSGSMIARIQKVYDNPTNGNRNAHHFVDVLWRDWWEKVEMPISDINEVVSRISRHVNNANTLTTVPIAEAMLQLRQGLVIDLFVNLSFAQSIRGEFANICSICCRCSLWCRYYVNVSRCDTGFTKYLDISDKCVQKD